jgi:c-di-GMP-binding flagellar brake protein YcgR
VGAEIVVSVEGFKSLTKVVLVEISENEARVRANVRLPSKAGLSFHWMGHSRDRILIHGHVAAVRMVDKQTAEYDVRLTMPDVARERLARELLQIERRKLLQTAQTHRKAYRVVTQFPIAVQAKVRGQSISLRGEARDLSIGGILLQVPSALERGTDLELSFSLPQEVVKKPARTKEIVEISPFGERIRKLGGQRRCEPIQAKARVVKRVGNTRTGLSLFGVNFIGMPSVLEEEIARWIHARQLQHLSRTSSANA